MKFIGRQKLHNYVFDIYRARTGEWLGPVAVSAPNLKEGAKAAKERYAPGGNPRLFKAVAAIRDGRQIT